MDFINSFFQNIKDKLTNPFFGSLAFVLIIHHWELWFMLFNFDAAHHLGDKLNLISKRVVNDFSWWSFLKNDVGLSLLITLLGYFVVVVTRTFSVWIEYKVMPFITDKIVSELLVPKDDFINMKKERDFYFDSYEEQRNAVRSHAKTIVEQSQQMKIKDQQNAESSKMLTESNTVNIKLQSDAESRQKVIDNNMKEVELLNTQVLNLIKNQEVIEPQLELFRKRLLAYSELFFETLNTTWWESNKRFPPTLMAIVNRLKANKDSVEFLKVGRYLHRGGVSSDESFNKMKNYGLIDGVNGEDNYLSPHGKILWNFRTIFFEDELFDLSNEN